MPVKKLLARIHEKDLEVFRREAQRHAPLLDETLPRLSHAANHSALWMGIAGLLWLFGGRFGRRAALRGLMSVALSSTIANGPAKLLARRERPIIDEVPLVRR